MKKLLLLCLVFLSLAGTAQASVWSSIVDYFKGPSPTTIAQAPLLGGETSDRRPVSTFLGLTDTPSSYTGSNGQCAVVNGAENALVFGPCGSGGGGSGGSNWSTSSAGILYPINYSTRRIVTGGFATTTNDFLQALNGFYANTARIGSLAGYIKGSTGTLSGTTTIPYTDLTGVPSFVPYTGATGNVTLGSNKLFVGSQALTSIYPNALSIYSNVTTSDVEGHNIGVVGAGLASSTDTNVWGVGGYFKGWTNSATRSAGVVGEGMVNASGDTGSSVGVRGYAQQTHAGGANIGLLGLASGGANNYALYMTLGDIWSSIAQIWNLLDNNSSALSFDTTGKTGILKIDTTDSAEGVAMSGKLNVTGLINNTALTASQLTATDASKNLQSLSTVTYPSLTEVSYLKGVTSSVQTQLDSKQASGSYLTSVAVATANGFGGSSGGGTTPSLTLTTSCNGMCKANGTAISTASNGTDYTLITAKDCTGIGHVVSVTAAGVFTCSSDSGGGGTGTPQDLYATSTPTFAGLNITGYNGYAKFTAGVLSATATLPYSFATTTISAGTGLSGGGDLSTNRTLTLNMAGGTCSAGSHLFSLSATGTVSCTADSGGSGGTLPQDLWATSSPSFATVNGMTFSENDTDHNIYAGLGTGTYATSTAIDNTFVGYGSGMSSTGVTVTADQNTSLGSFSLFKLTSGSANTAIGYQSLNANTTGISNVAIGRASLLSNVSGIQNVAIGERALSNNYNSSNNVAIGFFAGRYSSSSNSLYIDGLDRNNVSGDQNSALIYGKFASATSTQTLTTNSAFTATYGINIPTGQTYKINGADIMSTTSIGNVIASTTATTTPLDADIIPLFRSFLQNITWANIKAALKTYFDTLYQAVLVSGTNIKTINGSSILGSGDLTVSGGATSSTSMWTQLTGEVRTPIATTSLQIGSDVTANIATGTPIRWASGGVKYYDLVDSWSYAAPTTTINLDGAPTIVSANSIDSGSVYYGSPSLVVTETFTDPGAFGAASSTTMLASDLLMYYKWQRPPASLVTMSTRVTNADSGAANSRLNTRINGNSVSTSNSNQGRAVSTSWTDTTTDISTSTYNINYGDSLEQAVDGNGTNKDAKNLTIIDTFVLH